jgi:tetratricopeptide (TPR) repeat protein
VLARAGQVISGLLKEVEDGLALVSRAQELDPNLVIARYSSGWEYLYLGDVDAALKQFPAAVRLSPLDPLLFFAQTGIAFAHFMAGRYDDGSSWTKSAVLHQPNYLPAQFILAACHAMSGRAHSLLPNLGRTSSPICPDLIYDRHNPKSNPGLVFPSTSGADAAGCPSLGTYGLDERLVQGFVGAQAD